MMKMMTMMKMMMIKKMMLMAMVVMMEQFDDVIRMMTHGVDQNLDEYDYFDDDDDDDKDDVDDDDDDDLDDAVDVIVALVVVIVVFVVILLQEKCWRGRAKKKQGARSILQSQPSEGAPCVLAAKQHLAEHQPDNSQQSADLLKQSYVFYRESVVTQRRCNEVVITTL